MVLPEVPVVEVLIICLHLGLSVGLERWIIKVNATKTEAILLTKLRHKTQRFKVKGLRFNSDNV